MIKFDNVTYVYPTGVKALNSVSVEIGRGELVALMGENGAGKTTFIKHLNGLLKPTSGNVYVDGKDTKTLSVAQLSRIVGVVFQNADDMFFLPTVEEEVAFSLRNLGFSEDVVQRRVDWSLKFMELEEYRNRSPFLLSGGEKKRLALAIILAWNPQVIAMDEPTVGQDSMQKEKLKEMIKQLNLQGRTVIISTHDVEFVAELKPRVILMSKGRIIADGKAEFILTDGELLSSCSILMPQVAATMSRLADLGFNAKVISVEEAVRNIVEGLRGLEHTRRA
ncbi:MAG: energy-coupling factor ABC transporter ATP-binding protein [Thaumarchaeota archaeon]|jgi:energy-coupling factor transport system ATP-binding protein|nr:energy-coupling factor ABC transporter ATP-binding protein [Candidatus Terraquivivens yellowstonensis]